MPPMKEPKGFEGCHISICICFHVSCGTFRRFCYLNTSYKESDYIIFTPIFLVLHSFCAFPIGPWQNSNVLSVLGKLLCRCQSRHLALFSIKSCYIVVKLLHHFSPKKLWYFHVAYQQREMSLQRGAPRDQITKLSKRW